MHLRPGSGRARQLRAIRRGGPRRPRAGHVALTRAHRRPPRAPRGRRAGRFPHASFPPALAKRRAPPREPRTPWAGPAAVAQRRGGQRRSPAQSPRQIHTLSQFPSQPRESLGRPSPRPLAVARRRIAIRAGLAAGASAASAVRKPSRGSARSMMNVAAPSRRCVLGNRRPPKPVQRSHGLRPRLAGPARSRESAPSAAPRSRSAALAARDARRCSRIGVMSEIHGDRRSPRLGIAAAPASLPALAVSQRAPFIAGASRGRAAAGNDHRCRLSRPCENPTRPSAPALAAVH
jgi:hypothetical protein